MSFILLFFVFLLLTLLSYHKLNSELECIKKSLSYLDEPFEAFSISHATSNRTHKELDRSQAVVQVPIY